MEIVKIKKQEIFKKGDSLRVKAGVKHEESGYDMGGFQGRIIEIIEGVTDSYYLIEFDSTTLRQLSRDYIERSIRKRNNFCYAEALLSEVEFTEARDNQEDVIRTQKLLYDTYDCRYLDPYKDYDEKDKLSEDDLASLPCKNDDCENCKQCTDEEREHIMKFLKAFSIESFIFSDDKDQLYSMNIPRPEVNKLFCPVPIKEWDHKCIEFRKGYGLS